jgi:glycosyltransferase involved in cell wall biosynthesis
MKRKKIALYDPFLDVLGGGERHILSIIQVIGGEDAELTIFWDTDLTQQLKDKLGIHFDFPIHFKPNIFKHATTIEKLKTLKEYECFFYVTDGSYFFSSAKKNYVFCMVPQRNLYTSTISNKLKWKNYQFICNSKFTKSHLDLWGIKSNIIYPYLTDNFINYRSDKSKQKIILSVGRFFKHLHSKRQDVAIKLFHNLKKEISSLQEYKLILAGSLKDEDKAYYEELIDMAKMDTSIIFKTNISYNELFELYSDAAFYLHTAGYEVNESTHPERVEHLGITPLEAMATGAIPFCYKAGGIKELISDAKTGYTFVDQEELKTKLNSVIDDETLQSSLRQEGKDFIRNHFSYQAFAKRVKEVVQ